MSESRAQTQKGYRRLPNAIAREVIGIPETRKQRAEIKAQTPKLDPSEIDKNAYRAPVTRKRAPRDMPRRRAPAGLQLVRSTKTDHGGANSSD